MKVESNDGVNVYILSGKAILVFLSGGIIFHVIVMIIDYFLMLRPFDINMPDNFIGSIFSVPMIPMVVAYGLLSLGIFLLWEKTQKTVLVARVEEFQRENAENTLKSMQRLTGIMAQYIASQNSEIINWVEYRKRLRHPVPVNVESPSLQIARAIQTMSELTFIAPYTDNRPRDFCEFEKMLFYKLSDSADVNFETNHKLEQQ